MVNIEIQEEVWKMVNEQGMTVEEVAIIRGNKRETILDYLSRRVKRLGLNIESTSNYSQQKLTDSSEVDGDYKIEFGNTMETIVEDVILSSPEKVSEGKVVPTSLSDEIKELEDENVRLTKALTKSGKSLQLQMDNNRNLRKEKREGFRADAKADEFLAELVEANKIKGKELSKIEFPDVSKVDGDNVGVVQLSDLHLNEIINLPQNQYDLRVAAQRLHKHVSNCIQLFDAKGVKTVLLALTGDLLNSDRRIDEITNQGINRAKASVIAQTLILQVVMHLRLSYKVQIVSIMGNESRLDLEWASADNVNSNSFDYLIAANIKQVVEFSGIQGISFGDIDKQEMIIDINGQKWMLSHDCSRFTSSQPKTQSKMGAAHLNGQPFTYAISGHIHSTMLGDLSSRSASLAGTNEFAEIKLNLSGKASQNGYIVGKDYIIPFATDVQNVDGYVGYDIKDELAKHDIKFHVDFSDKKEIYKVR